jgi:hypothetical protein
MTFRPAVLHLTVQYHALPDRPLTLSKPQTQIPYMRMYCIVSCLWSRDVANKKGEKNFFLEDGFVHHEGAQFASVLLAILAAVRFEGR